MKVTVWCNRKLNSSVLKTGTALANMLRFHHARLLCLILESKSLFCGCISMFLFLQTSAFTNRLLRQLLLEAAFSWILSVKCSSVASLLWMQEGLGIRAVALRSALKASESMDDLQSPVFIEQCIPCTTSGLALVAVERTGSFGMLQELSQTFCG